MKYEDTNHTVDMDYDMNHTVDMKIKHIMYIPAPSKGCLTWLLPTSIGELLNIQSTVELPAPKISQQNANTGSLRCSFHSGF